VGLWDTLVPLAQGWHGVAVLAHGRGVDEAVAVMAGAAIVVGFVVMSRRRDNGGDE
jgi:hypothetical protein